MPLEAKRGRSKTVLTFLCGQFGEGTPPDAGKR